ncbi:hypothetical protein H5410_006338 [Solanum commersonii]|uniref:Uncharacterized protein n=1 Tax=Solanum commersonii TaxID=4109 RepID=A0A9J6A9L1_SOLCO|nr:hypothetical protein H5410_006338 [Solanum commersonii]
MRAYMIPPTKYRIIYSVTEESLELESLSDMTFGHPEEVKQGSFMGRMLEMLFIKLLLANSQVLLDTKLEFFTEISNFSCASTKEKVIYIDYS